METKICIKCGIEKTIENFEFRNDTKKYRNQCKECCKKRAKEYHLEHKEKRNEYNRNYYQDNKDYFSVQSKKYREEHKEEIKKANKIWREDNKDYLRKKYAEYRKNNRERLNEYSNNYYNEHKEDWKIYYNKYRKENDDKIKQYLKQWREENKEYIKNFNDKYYRENKDLLLSNNREYRINNREKLNEKKRIYQNERMENDPVYKFKTKIRQVINESFKRKGLNKNDHTENIVGCSLDFLYNYLLQTFKDNYGYDWDGIESVHIDHIIPLFVAKTEEEVIELCHYTNLQLLKAKDNLIKGERLDWSLDDE